MPFRGSEDVGPGFIADPLSRFFALEQALEQTRGLLGDRVPLRFVAVNLVLTPGDPAEITRDVVELRAGLDARLPWYSGIAAPMRLLLASALLKLGDDADAFCDELERANAMMNELGFRRPHVYRALTVLALRTRGALAPIDLLRLERVKAIYDAMKSHHWLLTGPEDIPACAFLSFQDDPPEVLAARAAAIYKTLSDHRRMWQGDPLQTASNVLALAGIDPELIADRFEALAKGLRKAGVRVGMAEYDEIALLCFLSRPVAKVIEAAITYRDRLSQELSWMNTKLAFSLGTNLAYVRLVGGDPELGPLADAKGLLDMQAIIDTRAAAAGAAVS
ncbi:DUF4003 family protein [Pseudenhygromyxa sp. WMMC2535]|uniref:DUF4003 family protein n=1 Tax=Pseudenhygromyxa sp. WMMC2535 TaxID=2712867 RepID=UPI00155739C5|nr:DUF4003 family protein [Pseudenhygromyxa sp. WMMC2535]NVB37762.1 DUF4003 family protein [Pseudenhygromyxa sp. WMMC2535]